jgi:alpha-tubulin suppressor-like RCC1 family protein
MAVTRGVEVVVTSSGRVFHRGSAGIRFFTGFPAAVSDDASSSFCVYRAIATKLFVTKVAMASTASHALFLTNDGHVYSAGDGSKVREQSPSLPCLCRY